MGNIREKITTKLLFRRLYSNDILPKRPTIFHVTRKLWAQITS